MKKLTTTTLAILLAACGGGEDPGDAPSDGDNGSDSDPVVDTTAPTVVGVSPSNGTTGVYDDAVMVIDFSEPMDTLSVQSTIDVNDLGEVAFDWSNDDRTLTITPNEPLLYAASIDPDGLDALQYTIAMGAGATDAAGNELAAGALTSFTTLRQISVTVEDINELTAAVDPSGVVGEPDGDVYIGDDGNGALAKASRGVVTMDLSSLPDETVEISSATLKAFQSGGNGDVFAELGALFIDHATFDVTGGDFETATELDCNYTYNLTALASVGTLMSSFEDVNVEMDVTEYAQDDLDNRVARNDRSQYRFRLFNDLNLDDGMDGVSLHRDFFEMDIVYLVP